MRGIRGVEVAGIVDRRVDLDGVLDLQTERSAGRGVREHQRPGRGAGY
jgi:hypothetical protein